MRAMAHLMVRMEAMDRFEALIRDALQDEAARARLPDGFSESLMHRLGTSPRLACGRPAFAGRMPRWAKVAAAVVLLASFAGFASWVGVMHSDSSSGMEESLVGGDPETEAISKQGENTMIVRKMATIVGAAMVSVAVPAEELTSEPTFVFLRPETSSFWNTATNSTMTVPIDYPNGATRATLEVSGIDYRRVYAGIADDEFTFEVPAPVSPETENVYDLVLTFDDVARTTRTAKLGLVQGLSPDAEGTTRCLAPSVAKVWKKVRGRTVLPIPYGTTSFMVNGVETDTGLGGAQGWYALRRVGSDESVTLSLVADGVEYMASLLGSTGLMVVFR